MTEPDQPPTYDTIRDALLRYTPAVPDRVPRAVAMHPATIDELRRRLPVTDSSYRHRHGGDWLFGVAVIPDPHMQPGAWQILGPNDILLRDSRSAP
jgi:hypothetical protein